MSQYLPDNEQEARDYAPRYRWVYILVFSAFALFSVRLWYLQIMKGAELKVISEQNVFQNLKIRAPRGKIYDRTGIEENVLVKNVPGYEVVVSLELVKNLEVTANSLAQVLNMSPQTVLGILQKKSGEKVPVRIKDNISREEYYEIELRRSLDTEKKTHYFDGVSTSQVIVRHYPLLENGAQLFGYLHEISKKQIEYLNKRYKGQMNFEQGDIIGQSGLESVFDTYLRGTDGRTVRLVDARGRAVRSEHVSLLGTIDKTQLATPGQNLHLTIDRDIQLAAFNSFSLTGRIGAAMAMKTNGEVLAWVSAPSFDPNTFSYQMTSDLWRQVVNDPDKPLMNKVIQDHNSPGSTFKPLVALAALAENVVSPSTIVACPGQMKFGNRFYHDTLKQGHGNLTITGALEQSANIFFYKMGIGLGIDKMFRYIDALGIGRKTGIELSGEETGLMPSSQWKMKTYGEEWQPGENLSVGIGQGAVLTQPLQIAVAYNAIATHGKVVKPFVVKKITNPDGSLVKEFEPQVRDLAKDHNLNIDTKVYDTVREGMRLVVNGDRGTARGSKLPFIEMAGKTGTSQVMSFSADKIYDVCERRPRHQRHHGWFIGYAPADNPEITVAVLAEHSCHGSSGAAPVAREMIRAWVAKYHPEWLGRDVHRKTPIKGKPEVTKKEAAAQAAPHLPPNDGAATSGSRNEGE